MDSVVCVGGAGLSAAMFIASYKLGRPYFRATVNCWFCSQNAKVKFQDRNAWTCPSCGQYNGFTSDGDYNRDIPEQHLDLDESYGVDRVRYAQPAKMSDGNQEDSSNGLCRTCNLNQELKIHQLKSFVPSNPEKYDEEIEEYKSHLEKTYRLCRNCEATLHQKLGEQDSWITPKLLAWKLEQNRQTALSLSNKFNLKRKSQFLAANDNPQKMATLLLSLAYIIGLFLQDKLNLLEWMPSICHSLAYSDYITLALLLILTIYCFNPWTVIERTCHQVTIMVWIAVFVHSACENFFSAQLRKQFLHLDILCIQRYARGCLAVACLVSSAFWSSRRSTLSARKRDRPGHKMPPISRSAPNDVGDNTLTQDLVSTASQSTTVRGLLRSPILPKQFGDSLPYHEVHAGYIDKSFDVLDDEDELDNAPCDISLLHIDKNRVKNHGAASVCSSTGRSPPFEVRTYDSTGSASAVYFNPNTSITNRKILKPAKFVYDSQQSHRVAQTSWVAGGYWHRDQSTAEAEKAGFADNFSRSSSQTSGFVSEAAAAANAFSFTPLSPLGRVDHFSSLPNSRVNSVCGDRHSVLSEPAAAPFYHRSTRDSFQPSHRPSFESRRKNYDLVDLSDDDDEEVTIMKNIFPEEVSFQSKKPKAESSPILAGTLSANRLSDKTTRPTSILEKKFQVTITLNSILLALSLTLNLGIAYYLYTNSKSSV